MKIVQFTKNDLIGNCVYSIGEIAGWPDEIADRLIQRGWAVLYGDGRPQIVGKKIPDGRDSGYWTGAAVGEHISALKQRAG